MSKQQQSKVIILREHDVEPVDTKVMMLSFVLFRKGSERMFMSRKQQMKDEYRQFKERLEAEIMTIDEHDPLYKECVRAIQNLSRMLK